MKILIGHRGGVDFDEPLKLSEDQRQKFIEFIKTLFDPSVVDVIQKRTPRIKRLGEKLFQVRWSRNEYALLLGTDSNEVLTEKLGRSWMSVVIKRGDLLPDFDAWCARNGYSRKGDYKELIEKYLQETHKVKKPKSEKVPVDSRKTEPSVKTSIITCDSCPKKIERGKSGSGYKLFYCPKQERTIGEGARPLPECLEVGENGKKRIKM
ncbi:MAG: hypothetical protein QW231_05910 [Candidatus Bathyarchaeia archaeon]